MATGIIDFRPEKYALGFIRVTLIAPRWLIEIYKYGKHTLDTMENRVYVILLILNLFFISSNIPIDIEICSHRIANLISVIDNTRVKIILISYRFAVYSGFAFNNNMNYANTKKPDKGSWLSRCLIKTSSLKQLDFLGLSGDKVFH